MDKKKKQEEERLEYNLLWLLLSHRGYEIVEKKHNEQYFQFTIRRSRR